MVSINDGNLHRECNIELANAHGCIRHLEAANGNLRDQNASLKAENERLRKIIEDATRTAAEMQEIFDHWVKTGAIGEERQA